MEKAAIKNKLFVIIPVVYIVLIFLNSIARIPFFDEAHSFLISQLNLREIFSITHVEGHPTLWYLLVKYTTINTKFYPYPMLILNWLIASVMILFFWFKFPFNKFEKTLIMFSYPFFSYFSVVARPYALTIFAVFLLCFFYKKNRPILFALLLMFAMNTTVVGMICAFSFGILFVFDLIKNKNIEKKQIYIISGIFLFELLLLCTQFYHVKKPDFMNDSVLVGDYVTELFSYIVNPFLKYGSDTVFKLLFKIVVFVLFWFSLAVFFKKSKEAFFYFILSNLLLHLLFIKIYVGAPWHYYFYFVNYIVAYSLCIEKLKPLKIYRSLFLLFLIMLLNPYSILKNGKIYVLNTSDYPNIVKDVLDFRQSHEGKYFCFDIYGPVVGVFPYLKNHNLKIYNTEGKERTEFSSLASARDIKRIIIHPKEFYSILDKTKNNYLLASMSELKDDKLYPKEKILKGENCELKFNLEFSDAEAKFAIYKIMAACNE